MPSVSRLAVALAVASLLLTSVAAPAAARAPPRAACAVCTDALDVAAAERGVELERAHTAMVVRVAENGSTRWTARVELARGADALRNDSLRADVVAGALARGRPAATPEGVSSRLDGDALVVSYRDADATARAFDALLFTGFSAADPANPLAVGGEGTVYAGADELAVRAPDGRIAWGEYGDATAGERAVRWAGDAAGESPLDRSTAVGFVREDAWLPGVRVAFARLLAGP